MSYAGDVTPSEAWKMLSQDKSARLVDVRTRPEWSFVGVPDLSRLGKQTLFLSWQGYPAMQISPDFVAELAKAVPDRQTPLFFLCRSGARSKAAAMAVTAAGYARCYNVSEGFEGNLDDERHRGKTGGWKAAGLPWVQE
ncbi:MAG: rhodanese-like domain-containing protein [Pseudomonadota bacterium]